MVYIVASRVLEKAQQEWIEKMTKEAHETFPMLSQKNDSGKPDSKSKIERQDTYEIQSPFADRLGEILFKFDKFIEWKGYEPSFEEVQRVGLRAIIIRHEDFRVYVNTNDHPPPHFHVQSNGESAAFSIETGKRIQGSRGLKRRDKIIKEVWFDGRHEIAEAWNDSRPTDIANNLFSIPAKWGQKPT